ncbi:MAG: hypothetical protein VKJ04_01830 [Vampirovibrionales bacterium]|nr:hypothetical protein [Vampirovibrionales bacterium]
MADFSGSDLTDSILIDSGLFASKLATSSADLMNGAAAEALIRPGASELKGRFSFAKLPVAQLIILLFLFDAGLLIYAVSLGNRPTSFMGEGKFITHLSFFQLMACGVTGLAAYFASGAYRQFLSSPAAVWLIIGLGFLFLGIDEVTQIHENLEKWILAAFHLPKNNITDRMDDFIILLYGLIGLGVIGRNFGYLRQFKDALPWVITAGVVAFASVMLDTLSHKPDIMVMLYKSFGWTWDRNSNLMEWLGVGEESGKIMAELFFLGAFLSAYNMTVLHQQALSVKNRLE